MTDVDPVQPDPSPGRPSGPPPGAAPAAGARVAGDRLHRPARLVVAVVELVALVAAGWAAVRCWRSARETMIVRLDDGTELVSRVLDGGLVGLAFSLATVAGVLLLDAGRQVLLGVGTRRRRRRRMRGARPPANSATATP